MRNLIHDAHVIRQNAEQLFQQFPVGCTAREVIHGFALAGLLGTLDPVFYGDFLSNYNREYPSGLGPSLSDTTSRLITFTETLSPSTVDYKKQQSEEFRAKTQENEIYGLLSKSIATPQGPQQLAATIIKHPQKAKLMALLSRDIKPPASIPKPVPDSTTPTVPLPAQACIDCKAKFIPASQYYRRCSTCQSKAVRMPRAAPAITDDPPADGQALAAFPDDPLASRSEHPCHALAFAAQPRLANSSAPASSLLAPVVTPSGYWDNGSSVHTTCDFSNILHVEPLATPFYIGGFGSGLQAIAKGLHPRLPAGFNTIYHTPKSNLTLFSIGYMVRKGCSTIQRTVLLQSLALIIPSWTPVQCYLITFHLLVHPSLATTLRTPSSHRPLTAFTCRHSSQAGVHIWNTPSSLFYLLIMAPQSLIISSLLK